jgi:hypothetical protein
LATAWGKPPSPAELLKSDQLQRAKIRWLRQEAGVPVTIEINAGEAVRMNPDWNPQPVRLPYDLKKGAALGKALRAANLGPLSKKALRKGERTLELLVEGDKSWVVVGRWTRPARTWKKQFRELYDQLEPLCDVLSEVFQPVKKDAAKTGDLKLAPNQ